MDGEGDACTYQDGTLESPFIISTSSNWVSYYDARDTGESPSDEIDRYPPYDQDESGPEYFYVFRVTESVRVTAEIAAPEPDGVDIDVHLLRSVSPVDCVDRGHHSVFAQLEPGAYYLSLDTFSAGGTPLSGGYTLNVMIRPAEIDLEEYFNDYILAAVDFLYENYALLGYDSAVLTHDIQYGSYGVIERTGGARTMCVAAVMEVILTALQLYAEETGDDSIWDFLPQRSWERLGANDIKAHLWVNHELDAGGSGDALRHFGMGENIPFRDLRPGSFINLNRTSGTGHAVVFLAFIDESGTQHETWNEDVVGFYYFSSQGRYDEGSGGFDYRYAIFDEYGSPEMPYRRDLHVIYSEDQLYLNTGMMFHPDLWTDGIRPRDVSLIAGDEDVSFFDAEYFDGLTTDD